MGRVSTRSRVIVTFKDGEVKEYQITASVHLARYLAEEASRTGVLVLFSDETSHCIPIDQIREYELIPEESQEGDENG